MPHTNPVCKLTALTIPTKLAKPGSMGRPYPGHRAAVIDENGKQLGPGKMGEIAFYAS